MYTLTAGSLQEIKTSLTSGSKTDADTQGLLYWLQDTAPHTCLYAQLWEQLSNAG